MNLCHAMATVAPFLIKQKVFSSRNYRLTVTSLMFYDVKRNTSLQIEAFRADMLVFRKSIFGGALNYINIWPIIPGKNFFLSLLITIQFSSAHSKTSRLNFNLIESNIFSRMKAKLRQTLRLFQVSCLFSRIDHLVTEIFRTDVYYPSGYFAG